ncbi:hypothetical protein [Nocardia sp. SSK8]|uniref:hypothetical protein n=1 Tax=Nocardia sp. SSK8 TaxID=3120154 RepID=UPI00300B088F
MKLRVALLGGLAVALVQLPLAAPASAACGPHPVPCSPSSSEGAGTFLAFLEQVFTGSAG